MLKKTSQTKIKRKTKTKIMIANLLTLHFLSQKALPITFSESYFSKLWVTLETLNLEDKNLKTG